MSSRPSDAPARPPRSALVVAAIGLLVFVVVPLAALLQRAPWSTFLGDLGEPAVRDALRLSIVCSLAATTLAVVFGFPIAWMLARTHFPGRRLVRAVVLLPMVLPPVVGGLALLTAFGRRGLAGQHLYEWFGWQISFTTWAAILAETFVALPFFVIAVDGALRSVDARYEEAAATLGAAPSTIMRRITVPAIMPSLGAGAALAWARALGEFGATITFAGNLRGETQTMPLAVYLALETDRGAAITLSLVLLAISVVVLAVVGRRTWSR